MRGWKVLPYAGWSSVEGALGQDLGHVFLSINLDPLAGGGAGLVEGGSWMKGEGGWSLESPYGRDSGNQEENFHG